MSTKISLSDNQKELLSIVKEAVLITRERMMKAGYKGDFALGIVGELERIIGENPNSTFFYSSFVQAFNGRISEFTKTQQKLSEAE